MSTKRDPIVTVLYCIVWVWVVLTEIVASVCHPILVMGARSWGRIAYWKRRR